MTLTQYIQARRGNAAKLAQALGVTPARISQIASDSSKTNPERCMDIVRATGGLVTIKDLRPKDWHLIWRDAEWDGITERRTGPASRRAKDLHALQKAR